MRLIVVSGCLLLTLAANANDSVDIIQAQLSSEKSTHGSVRVGAFEERRDVQWRSAYDISEDSTDDSTDNTDEYLKDPGSRVIVLPKYKLAFCWIDKNANTDFNALFNKINGFPQVDYAQGPWGKSRPESFGLTLRNLTRKEGWKWAGFFRDPLQRYASAFQSKCAQREDMEVDPSHACCEPRSALVDNASDPQNVIDKFVFSVEANYQRAASKLNPHYGNQIDFCGGVRNIDFDFQGLLEGNVHEQVVRMLSMVEVEKAVDLASLFFPASGEVHGHRSENKLQLYQDQRVQDKVTSMYELDVAYVKSVRDLISANR